MKKTVVALAAWMLMMSGAVACAQQPEKKEAPEQTEQTTATSEEAVPEKTESAAETGKEESAPAKEEAKAGDQSKCGGTCADKTDSSEQVAR